MGTPKALLPVPGQGAGETFLERIVRLTGEAGVTEVVVAVGPPHGLAIRQANEHLVRSSARSSASPSTRSSAGTGPLQTVSFAENPDPARGMLTSVQAAVRALPAEAEGTLVWPVDTPFVQNLTVFSILALAQKFDGGGHGDLVIPTHNGRGGHPIWVGRRLFQELLALPAEAGLRQLRVNHPQFVHFLDVADAGILRDLDTPADLWQALRDRDREK
jgi:CTP:molybdopterin cytidylyltransferase MocA